MGWRCRFGSLKIIGLAPRWGVMSRKTHRGGDPKELARTAFYIVIDGTPQNASDKCHQNASDKCQQVSTPGSLQLLGVFYFAVAVVAYLLFACKEKI